MNISDILVSVVISITVKLYKSYLELIDQLRQSSRLFGAASYNSTELTDSVEREIQFSSSDREHFSHSTPILKSETGRRIIKKHFLMNLPVTEDSMLEPHLDEITEPEQIHIIQVKHVNSSSSFEIKTPKSISPTTRKKYDLMIEENFPEKGRPKLTRRCIRL